ncbi:MAG: hypothetical protein CSA18_01330 [Deltaproteobacteria bacterium]|nr:MAG: hypothetical protein CSA18_01330 [Deltaproteobacteria bacterium]
MKFIIQVLYESFKKFNNDECMTLSSAISFIFLMSLVPFMTLAVKLFNLIQKNFFTETNVNQVELVINEMNKIIPFVSSQWFKLSFMDKGTGPSLTLFALIMLPIISGMIFHELENAYRKIFNLSGKNSLLRQFFYAFFTIFFLLFVFITNFVVTLINSLFSEYSFYLKKSNILYEKINYITHALFLKLEIASLISLVLFFLFTSIIFLPSDLKIKPMERIIPAFIFAFLWISAKALFSFYLKNISVVNLLYGSISTIIIMLVWIFYSSITLLFSVEIMYSLHTPKKAQINA